MEACGLSNVTNHSGVKLLSDAPAIDTPRTMYMLEYIWKSYQLPLKDLPP
jgi:hypothetical protein